MSGSADAVQAAVHALESGSGRTAVWVRRALVAALIAGLSLFYLLYEFRGLSTSEGMDQAQIGRALLYGHGWQTNFARPLAAGLLQRRGRNAAQKIWTDTYNAPLPPLIDAIALFPARSHLKLPLQDAIYLGDRMIALISILLFLASLFVLFLIASRLFDQTLALVGCALILISDIFWQYALSGLPQMMLLLLFNLIVYLLVRALGAQMAGSSPRLWLGLAGLGFGLLALSHALTIWIFLPALIFCVIYFRPRLWTLTLLLAPFLLLYLPWLIRNFLVSATHFALPFTRSSTTSE
jgi:Dolichyl-phosphate-mannose-protein mannosyltransferase